MTGLLRIAFWAAALFAFVMAVLPHPPDLHVWDKLQHMTAFFVITMLGLTAYPQMQRTKLLVALVAFGGFIELVQMIPFVHRDGDVRDWIADILAVLLALGCYSVLRRFRSAPAE